MSLFVIDTDILGLFQTGHVSVQTRVLFHAADHLATTVITVEEQLSGWYTLVRRVKAPEELARAYQRLAENVQFLAQMQILPFSQPAIARYEQLKSLKLGVKKMDLRIAAITLEYGGILVTRNLRDFQSVPSLVCEDWSN